MTEYSHDTEHELNERVIVETIRTVVMMTLITTQSWKRKVRLNQEGERRRIAENYTRIRKFK